MIYRNHREYDMSPKNQNHEILRNWLKGETNVESLKTWLSSISG